MRPDFKGRILAFSAATFAQCVAHFFESTAGRGKTSRLGFGILRAMPSLKSRRILVIDDSIDHAESFTRLLEALGHQAEFATTPQAALAVARRLRPHIVCLDISMPLASGYELARMFRAEFGYESMRMVAVTAYSGEEYRVRSRQAGFDAHIVKPVSIEILENMLATVGDSAEG